MCGINGIVDFNGRPVLRQEIEAMNKKLGHRGPDGEGVFFWDNEREKVYCGLGHRRLSIIDIEGGSQPMTNEDGTIAVTYNGEIYNFSDLRSSLLQSGHIFKSKCDTEVIVHQYEEDGIDFVKHFNGMYSFALWDSRVKRLILARDRIGIKPLFYTRKGDRIIFSSEIKPILKAIGYLPDIDEEAIFRYLLLQYIPSPRTPFMGIYKLPPGSILIFDESGIRCISSYWDVSDKTQLNVQGRPEEYLFNLLSDSVKKQLMSDVPVGAFLSGGIDSSAVVYIMSRLMDRPVKTFSVGFEGPDEYNETSYASMVAAHCHTEHYEIMMRDRDVPDLFLQTIQYLDEPISDPAILPTFLVSTLARQHVKVVLSGEGADELLGGYKRYALDRLSFFYPKFLLYGKYFFSLPLYNDPRKIVKGMNALSNREPHKRHLAWTCAFLNEEMKLIWRGKRDVDSYYNSIVEEFLNIFANYHENKKSFHRMQYSDLKTWLPDDLLTKIDRMTMAVSLEGRVPFLDHRIVETAFSAPDDLLLRGWRGKYLLRKAFENKLPKSILYRRKKGFSPPLNEWFRRELRPFITDKRSTIDLIAQRGIEELLSRHLEGKSDMSLPLWSIITLNAWYQRVKEL